MSLTHAGCVAFKIVNEQTLFLIVSSSNNQHWVLPKGHIEPQESPESAALRELAEEAGIMGETICPLGIQTFIKFEEKVSAQYFLVKATDSTHAQEERTLRWEKKNDALRLLSFEESRNALQEGAEALCRTD